ncbi:GDP-L-fucose synthase [Vibrio cholerae]|nr:SDR family oxidoreductase [Vibrio cholerae]TXX80911.1 SDR family oxidoreductase [Vibrio cholerae]BCN17194.1 putative monosaccharide biosynthesis protein [Vibrio cholerae]GHY82945.1 GDP-L-fucose synthase [Vibrio cholerae]
MDVLVSEINKIIISGFRGYIGSVLKEHVSNISRNDWNVISLADLNLNSGRYTFIHLASKANAENEELETLFYNLSLDLEVFKFVSVKNCRLIYFSGNNVYPKMINADINDANGGDDFYSKSKYLSEKILRELPNEKFTIFRVADVFGKGQRHGNFFKSLESSIKNNTKIRQYSYGRKLRNYIYIDELVKIILYFVSIDKFKGRTYNITYKDAFSLFEIINFTAKITELPVEIDYEFIDDKCDVRVMEASDLEGYIFSSTMSEALNKYINEIKR